MKSVIIFGGSGFVGMHLTHMLGNLFNKIYIADIKEPKWHGNIFPDNPNEEYIYCDVRKKIDPNLFKEDISHIVNLAAVHTSPGHPSHEYFEANILGAENICNFAKEQDINHIFFTSSISVYGPCEDEKSEKDIPMPSIPYGSSKIIAEYIHRDWLNSDKNRKLSVVRPAVIFGAGEGGNFTRIANALEKGFFAYPGRRDTIKGCLYVKDLCRYIIDRLKNEDKYSIVNFCYPEKISTQTIVKTFKKVFKYRSPEFVVPLSFIFAAASILNLFPIPFIKRMGLVPDRIRKLVHSTNISSEKLIQSGFEFKYNLESALKDWSKDCNGKHLY